MRKRKPAPATYPQQVALRNFHDLGARNATTAAKPPATADANTLNRLSCRGWLAKASEGRWFLTEDGSLELQRHLVAGAQAAE